MRILERLWATWTGLVTYVIPSTTLSLLHPTAIAGIRLSSEASAQGHLAVPQC